MSEDPSGRHLPDRQTVIQSAGGQPSAVAGEGQRTHPASGPLLERRRFMNSSKVSRDVEPNRPVASADGQQLAVR
ncbi:MAG: hypothetical protein WBQ29_02485 [Isosphaeraceae bacterium]